MSRPDRINEERQKYFLSFEKDFGNDLDNARIVLKEISTDNEGQRLRKSYLKEWITSQEAPIEQKQFQEEQLKTARNANIISTLALLIATVALIVSMLK